MKIAESHSASGGDDIVFWGNDGGLSKGSKPNNFISRNGDLIAGEIYDVDVSVAGGKRAAAIMHGSMVNTTNNSNWQNQDAGDGFNAVYDHRSDFNNLRLLYHSGWWSSYIHSNTSAVGANVGFSEPIGGIDQHRAFQFPHDFDLSNGLMYLGNKNMFESTPNGYAPWSKKTNTGDLSGDIYSIVDDCRALALAPSNKNRQYFAIKKPGNIPDYPYYFNNDRFYTRDVNNAYGWKKNTPAKVLDGSCGITDITVDPVNPNRVFISLGGIDWQSPPTAISHNRVLCGIVDPITDMINWTDMSKGLTELPVLSIIYQEGSDDIIYAGTDNGVYRWDKPQQCWIHFNNAKNGGKMPNVLINDLEIDYCKGTLVAASYGRGIWESDLYHLGGVFPGVSKENTIDADKTWTGNKHINSSILIKSGATLTIGDWGGGVTGNVPNASYPTNVYMPKFGVIYIEKGARLVLVHARITNGCSFWYGIQTFGNDFIGQWIGPNGLDPEHGVVECYKSKIENAEEAVTNAGGDASPYGNTGGILILRGVHFYNNRRSVQFLKFTNTSTGNLLKDYSAISDCYFNVDQNSRQEFSRHITMWGVRGVELTSNRFYNEQSLTKSHETAIETIDASYDLNDGLPPFGKSITQGFYKGVVSNSFNWSSGNIYPIKIRNTKFEANEIGLELGAMNYPIIMENKFTIGAKQTPLPGGSGWQYYSLGSIFDRVSNFIYCSNEHEKTIPQIPQSSFQYTAGTEIHSSGENNQKVNRNKYRSLFIGTDVDYTCGDNSNKTGIYFTCNNNENNTGYDYIFQANPIIKKAQVNQYPGFPSFPVGNTFSQNATVKHWEQASGGNAPVDYVHSNLAGEIPTNINSSNIHLVQMPYDFNKCGEDKCGYTVAPKADNLSLLLSDINGLISEFSSKEQSYQNYKVLYTQLIDGGNTEMTREEVEQSTSDEAIQIKADLLAKSPYVSQDVLFALAERNSLPQAFLFEILMSNPDATKDERFLDYLQFEKPNPMPSYMIEMIKASWSGATVRSALEDNIANTYSKMSDLRNELVVIYSSSPEFSNEQNLLTWLNKVPTLHNQYEVIEFLLAKKEYQQAEQILNALPAQFKLEGLESESYLVYKELYYFKKSLLENNIEINKLSSSQIQELNTIANSSVPCVARTMARSALCFFYKICFPLEERQIPTPLQSKFKLTASSEKVEKVKAYPNPANDYVVFALENSELNPMISIRISDMTGKQVYSSAISKGSIQHIWDSRKIQSNTYVYVITTQSGEKYTGKITVQK